jgi:Putative beta-barrel porin 2
MRSLMTGSSCRAGTRGIRDSGSARLRLATAALAAFVAVGAPTPVRGQISNRDTMPVRSSLSPTIRLTVGSDDNVFRVSEADKPIDDFSTTISPAVQAALVRPRLRVSGRSEVDFITFRKVSEINSVDSFGDGRVELLLWRLTPYVGGDWANTRHRRNFEIDLPIRQVDSSWNAGVDLRISGKTSIGVVRRQSREDYRGDTIYLGTDLARYLDATAVTTGAELRHSLTPFTTIGVDVEQDRTEFASATERNSDGFAVASVIEFRPRALVSGRARVGIRRRTFSDGNAPPYRGVITRFDLAYTLLGRTRFAIAGRRDLSYSYRLDQRDYVPSGVELTVNHRVANGWDVVGAVGRFNLDYGLGVPSALASRSERGLTYRMGVGYHIQKTIVGIEVSRETRTSDFSVGRDYEATRIASSVSYGF